MHRKLLLYMLTLVLVVVMFIAAGLFFVGQFSTTTEKYSNNLTFQNEFYTRQIEKFFDDLSMMTEMLANDSSAIIEDYLNEKGKFCLNDTGLVTYSHGEYFLLGKKVGSFGYSVQKKKKKISDATKRKTAPSSRRCCSLSKLTLTKCINYSSKLLKT